MTKANFHIDELIASLKNKNTIINLKNALIRQLKKEMIDKPKKSVERKKNESNEKSNHHFISFVNTESSVKIKHVKIIILSDPNEFIDKNKLRIDDWALKIENKFNRNASLFSTEDLKIEYVQNFIDGQAFRCLKQRFRSNVKNFHETASAIVENFRRMYDDFNRRLKAVNAFRNLRMKNNNFNVFWAKFQKFSSEFDHGEFHLLKKFIYKLSFVLQKHFSMKCDKATDLYELAEIVKKTTNRWRTTKSIKVKYVKLNFGRKKMFVEKWRKRYWRFIFKDWKTLIKLISDRNLKYNSDFWRTVFKICGISLNMIIFYHLSADGQAEKSNQIVEVALKCLLIN